jgi:hypothetical protein
VKRESRLAFRATGATVCGVAGEQKAKSLGSRRGAQVRRVDSSDGGSRRTYIIIGLIAAAFVAGFATLVILDTRQNTASAPPGEVQTYDVGPANQHTQADVDYEQNPPVGGEHNPVWQNCGYYAEPVRDENAVHSLEHGAVWITYSPDLPQDEAERLRDIAENENFVLVSPRDGLPSPVVASAWGKQLRLQSAEDPGLERFVGAYQQGPQTPEQGAVCTGGIGQPV